MNYIINGSEWTLLQVFGLQLQFKTSNINVDVTYKTKKKQ